MKLLAKSHLHFLLCTLYFFPLTPAHAWEYRCRFVERVGTTDIPLEGNTIDASSTAPRRIRIQFGVFDDALSPAPAGGHVGWNIGTIRVAGEVENSSETRTPGRLAPFNFATGGPGVNGNPPLPGGDPFTTLTDIDATLGTQAPLWLCAPDGTPGPIPHPRLRGFNEFVSNYEITIDPRPNPVSYTITFAGNLIAAVEWRTVGTPQPPDCQDPAIPDDDIPGAIAYAPFPTSPIPFQCVLTVMIPAPASLGIAAALGALALRRNRLPRSSGITS